MADINYPRLFLKNLLYSINAVVGSELFKHIYVRDENGKEFDAMADGELSCAYVVSGVLAMYGLIDRPHATVGTTLAKLLEAGWYQVDDPQPADIVHWPDGVDGHAHIGFYLGNNKYISNSTSKKHPVQHHSTLQDGREPDAYYSHPRLRSA